MLQRFEFDKNITFVDLWPRKLIRFHINIADKAIPSKNLSNMSLSVVGFFVADGSIDYRHQIFHIFVVEGVRDNIPSFHMIGEKYFKVGIVHVVDSHVDGVILRAGI